MLPRKNIMPFLPVFWQNQVAGLGIFLAEREIELLRECRNSLFSCGPTAKPVARVERSTRDEATAQHGLGPTRVPDLGIPGTPYSFCWNLHRASWSRFSAPHEFALHRLQFREGVIVSQRSACALMPSKRFGIGT